ncbi:hydrolase [Oenococcus oeni]|uniref:hydrolase n=1 Tax=Oenococcus oeni TaxID=1247 RepID=UPI0008F88E76|nr:hydrolase [Oenococcus oeni]OIM26330.1 hydrolase [Oenococcus oeni]
MTTSVKFLSDLKTLGNKIVSFSDNETRVLIFLGFSLDSNKNKTSDKSMGEKLLSKISELVKENPETIYKKQAIFIPNLPTDCAEALESFKAEVDMPIYVSFQSGDLYSSSNETGERTNISNLRRVDYEKEIKIGSFTVNFFHSDQKIINSSVIKISDSNGHVFVYFGALGYSESSPEKIDHWIQKLANRRADLLLLEGADFSFDNPKEKKLSQKEKDLIDNFADKLGSNHLVAINPDLQHILVLSALEKAARNFGRPIVWEKNYSNALKKFFSDSKPLTLGRDIDLPEIIAYPEDYVLQNSYDNLDNLKDFYKPIYLQIDGQPLDDHDSSYKIRRNKLNDLSAEFLDLGIFGQTGRTKLIKIVKQINAKLTIPFDSPNFEDEVALLKAEGLTAKLPEKNQDIEFQ